MAPNLIKYWMIVVKFNLILFFSKIYYQFNGNFTKFCHVNFVNILSNLDWTDFPVWQKFQQVL